ncbi:ankyrin repeat domain-containing protein [Legionella erythra]|uniref:Ankyrin repeat protein n=1 Tax=Legionella erythra TaxID=448 RepID=A0A0W0TRG9_LEGER|nr:ankyrin repeat domain-containing protein [Legionella erythra]KTC97973.1 Ankyrin repeat protein [Legionella erythra]
MIRDSLLEGNDVELEFRKAAASGKHKDIAFMRSTIKRVRINQPGPSSGMTALHQACKNGKINAVNFLLAHGADPDLKDAKNKTAYDYADDKEVIESLKLFNLGKRVSKPVNAIYSEKPDESSDKIFDELSEQISISTKKAVESMKNEGIQIINDTLTDLPDNERERIIHGQLPAFNERIDYLFGLVYTSSVLSLLPKSFRKGYCDIIASSIFCLLFKEKMRVEKFHLMADSGTHVFVVLNRDESSDLKNPDTWGTNAYFINWHDQVYPVQQRPEGCILNQLKRFKQIIVTGNQRPAIQPKIIKKFAELSDNLMTEWENKLCSLSPIKLDEIVGCETGVIADESNAIQLN